ncbi:MAG: hypothetical protein SXA11_03735 [Cyanobacteriota bacterium]|nr:hypothetical protein [Cyanobacteriota bacterium]
MLKHFPRLSDNKILLLILYILPVALLLWFVASFSVNVPFWDQWRLVNMFDKVGSGNASFSDFFEVHGHHRIFFPKIIITALAFASGWNTQYEIICSVIFVVITFWFLCKIAASKTQNKGDNLMHIANILTCMLLFSLVQHQNWLWGFTLFWFLTNLCLVMAVFFLCCNEKRSCGGEQGRHLFYAGTSCFIGSFTLAQGLLAWPILIPAVFSLEGNFRQKLKRVLIWMGIFLVSCFIYSLNYNPIREPQPFLFLERPFVVINYFFTVLSLPLVRVPIPSIIVGFLLFSCFLFFCFYFIRIRGKMLVLHPEALPWLSVGSFAIISSLSITAGRAQYGVENAIISSRYTTTSVLLIVALIHLLALFWRQNSLSNSIFTIGAVILTGIIAVNSIYVINRIKTELPYMQGRKECLEIINYLEKSEFMQEAPESCLVLLNGKTWLVREGAEIMDKLGWREFPDEMEFVSTPERVYGYLDTPPDGLGETGKMPVLRNEAVTVTGWATIPEREETPNLVLLSSGENRTFFANAYVVLDSPDLAKTLKSKEYKKARWQAEFSGKDLGMGEGAIAAWVYNAKDKQFVKLSDELKIEVKKP